MHISAIKTHKITVIDSDILSIIDTYVPLLTERSVVAVTSKIVAICEGSVVDKSTTSKEALVKSESQLFIPPDKNKYGTTISIKNNIFVASAGIDESNSSDGYVLWPRDSYSSANKIRTFLRKKYNLSELGVIITDSTTRPLRWGVTGISIGYSGFVPLNNMIGTSDLFGHTLKVTKVNVYDALGCAAVFVMGEGNEQTPIAVISDLPSVKFVDSDPSQSELDALVIEPQDDLYHPLIANAPWEVGDLK